MESNTQFIIRELNDGNKKVFKEIFHQNFTFLCHYAENILKNKSTAEDIVEEFFVRLWEKHETIRIRSNLKSYMLRSVHNQCIDHLRHEATGPEYQIESYTDLSLLNLSSACYMDSEKIEWAELDKKINEAIGQLPEACRNIFLMSRFDDLTYREIAERLNVSVNTVEMQMSRALKKLRVSLKEYLPMLLLSGSLFALLFHFLLNKNF